MYRNWSRQFQVCVHSFNLFQFVLNLMISVRRVVVEQKQWKDGIKVVGGRGRGLFIKSESTTSRINTGDQILQVSGCGYVCMGVTLFTIWWHLSDWRAVHCKHDVLWSNRSHRQLRNILHDSKREQRRYVLVTMANITMVTVTIVTIYNIDCSYTALADWMTVVDLSDSLAHWVHYDKY